MEKFGNRFVFLICLLSLTAALVWSHRIVYGKWRPKNDLELPMKVGGWVGKIQKVSQMVYGLLEADTVLIRNYSKDDEEIWFAAVYYRDNQVGFHAPESCFGGLGQNVFDGGSVEIFVREWDAKVRVKELHYKGAKGEKILFYFYVVDDFVADSELKIRLRMLLDQLKFKRPGVALIEMYSPVGVGGVEKARENLKDFLSHLLPKLPEYMAGI